MGKEQDSQPGSGYQGPAAEQGGTHQLEKISSCSFPTPSEALKSLPAVGNFTYTEHRTVHIHLLRLMSALNRSPASQMGSCRTILLPDSRAQWGHPDPSHAMDKPSIAPAHSRTYDPQPSRHVGYSHSRHSLLLQHQHGCQRSQNQLAKNKTKPQFQSGSLFQLLRLPCHPHLSPASRRDHLKLQRAFKWSLNGLGSSAQDSCSISAPTTPKPLMPKREEGGTCFEVSLISDPS